MPHQAKDDVFRAADVLGGKRVWKRPPTTKMEAHETIPMGIPGRALNYMIGKMRSIPTTEIATAIGIGQRTMQRYAGQKSASLGGAPSARLWKLAEILVAAGDLQGSREAVEKWLSTPQMALDRRTPHEMMPTSAGAEMVEDLLARLDYRVYT